MGLSKYDLINPFFQIFNNMYLLALPTKFKNFWNVCKAKLKVFI